MINAKHKKYDNFLRSALIPCRLFLDSELLTIHDYDGEFSFYVDIINNKPKMNGQEIRCFLKFYYDKAQNMIEPVAFYDEGVDFDISRIESDNNGNLIYRNLDNKEYLLFDLKELPQFLKLYFASYGYSINNMVSVIKHFKHFKGKILKYLYDNGLAMSCFSPLTRNVIFKHNASSTHLTEINEIK